jgi:hypothetical protein
MVEDNAMEEFNSFPMVFKWEHGGRNVAIIGTFNDIGDTDPNASIRKRLYPHCQFDKRKA